MTNYGTIVSTAGTAGIAVELGYSTGNDLLIVEKGAVFVGQVEGGGHGEIEFVAGGVANMTSVSGFETVALGNGASHSLTLTDANFGNVSPGEITIIGGNDGNTVNASSVTAGPVTMIGGAGADVFTGGAGNDIFEFTQATLTGADKVAGGGGSRNALEITTPGTVAASRVSGVEIYRLANGGANSLTLTNANFTGVLGGAVSVYGGTGGNTIDGSGLTGAGDNLVIYGGRGSMC